jgi:hypothetical protein
MAVASLANCATHDKHFEASQAIDSFRLVNPWLLVSLVLLIYEWSGGDPSNRNERAFSA